MTTRAELIADLDVWLARDDLSSGGNQDTMLRIAQANINRRLRVQAQEVITQLVCTSRTTPLPVDYQALRSLSRDTTMDRSVTYLTPERIRESPVWQNQGGATGVDATAYTIEAQSVTLAPAPTAGAPVTLDIVYIGKFDDLVNPADSNWLLLNNYDIYLWAILEAAAIYLEDDELLLKYKGLFDVAVGELIDTERRARTPPATGLIATGHPRAVV